MQRENSPPHKEPEEHFLPLSSARYCDFYDLEMDSFLDDLLFYQTHLAKAGGDILEMGCGSGRLSSLLAEAGHNVTGVDISYEMVRRAKKRDNRITWKCSDMCNLTLARKFQTVIIPYNTINLLIQPKQIRDCLASAHNHLFPKGLFLAEIHIPAKDFCQPTSKRTFQFKTLEHPEGGRIIKETLRSWQDQKNCILVEERYRIRPTSQNTIKEDLSHTFSVIGRDAGFWQDNLSRHGFRIINCYSSYDLTPFIDGDDGRLLIAAEKI